MNLVNLEAASKAYGQHALLDEVSLGVAAGDRIGVVGRNGAGKTTLLDALAGRAGLDSGRATRARELRLGYLPQAVRLAGRVRDVVFGALPEHQWAPDVRSRSVLAALLAGIDIDAESGRLSGGESRRVALGALLRETHDLLLLDEPTNHLDIGAIRWLADHLRSRGEAVVVVTHDRWFLDAVTDRTWEVADGRVHSYDGGYSAYVLARAERARLAEAADQRRRNLLRKELAWLRRGPPARTSKPKFRLEVAAALIAGEPAPRDGVQLTQLATARLGRTVLEIEDVTVTAGQCWPGGATPRNPPQSSEQRRLLDGVTWRLGPGDRVGVVGENGSGKTTLLRLLAGEVPAQVPPGSPGPAGPVPEPGPEPGPVPEPGPEPGPVLASGRVVRGATVRIGSLTQEPPAMDPQVRALDAAERVRRSVLVGRGEVSASQLLERLGLRGDRQWTPVGELSGGERRRLQLMLVLLDEPNVLLLDEPTNDLDIDTLTELEDMLDGWPGSLVAVSHDRYFLERVTDHVLVLDGGALRHLPGGIDEYLEGLGRARAAGSAAPGGPARPPGAVQRGPAGPRSPESAGPAGPAGPAVSPAARQRAARKELDRLERRLGRVSARERELAAALAASASDYTRLIELGGQLRAVQDEKARLEDRWLAVAEELPD